MNEISTMFIRSGFPEIYPNICGIDDILGMYERDLHIHTSMKNQEVKEHPSKSIPVTYYIRNKGKTVLNLIPGKMFISVISKNKFYCLRTYYIEEKDIQKPIIPFTVEEKEKFKANL